MEVIRSGQDQTRRETQTLVLEPAGDADDWGKNCVYLPSESLGRACDGGVATPHISSSQITPPPPHGPRWCCGTVGDSCRS